MSCGGAGGSLQAQGGQNRGPPAGVGSCLLCLQERQAPAARPGLLTAAEILNNETSLPGLSVKKPCMKFVFLFSFSICEIFQNTKNMTYYSSPMFPISF